MKRFNRSLIWVHEGNGQLTVGDAGLDSERLCGRAPQCVLSFDVVSSLQEQFQLVHVEGEVRDVNDHAPRFTWAQIPVEVSEGAALGTRIPLEVPVDEDVGANGLQRVHLAEPHSPFRVELQTRADGAQSADLVLLQELDRESQGAYSLELVAQDVGRPPRSATAALSARVLDAGDHSPAFPEGAVAEVELAEDAPVGSLLLDLDAADPDEGPNGDVVFSFGARTPPEARRLFRLDPHYRLTLAGPVDYERQDTYQVDVRAQDLRPGRCTDTCKVIVRFRDVNDNSPDIAITWLAAPDAPATSPFAAAATAAALGGSDAASSWGSGTREAGATSLVPERAVRESLAALVSTSDRDSGANGQMRCALYRHEPFQLEPAAGSYLVVTAASLDHERIAEYNLTLVAEDRGAPPPLQVRAVRPYTVRLDTELGARRQRDLSVVLLGVLVGGCGLLLVAIVTVACSCQRGARTWGKELCVHSSQGFQATGDQAGPSRRGSGADSGAFDSKFFTETQTLSFSSEAQDIQSAEVSQSGDMLLLFAPREEQDPLGPGRAPPAFSVINV
ncbi:LOW QUALITY PROTEIN: protocadherin-8-like [Trichechus inunguis]